MDKKTAKILEGALRKGNCIHAFLSGGGLRVIRIEKKRNGKLLGYGEHPEVDEALRHVAEDFAAGGRPYNKVYGPKGLYAHPRTGSSETTSDLDAWIRQGRTFDIRSEGDQLIVELRGFDEFTTPDSAHERALNGDVVLTENRGYTYETKRDSEFGGGVTTSVIKSPGKKRNGTGADPWMWHIVKTGRAANLSEAFEQAFKAESEEEKAS